MMTVSIYISKNQIDEMHLNTWGTIHSTKISRNFGLKLNGSDLSNWKSFEKINQSNQKLTVPFDSFGTFSVPVPR